MKKVNVWTLGLLAVMLFSTAANAQGFKIGGGLVYGFEIEEPGLQVNGVVDIPVAPIRVAADIAYFFVEDAGDIDLGYWTLNGNVHYTFLDVIPKSTVYVLAGLNFTTVTADGTQTLGPLTVSVDDSETRSGINLGGGADFNVGPVDIFTELKFVIVDDIDDQLVGTVGLRFGLGK